MSKTTKEALPEGENQTTQTPVRRELISKLEASKAVLLEARKPIPQKEAELRENQEKQSNLKIYVARLEKSLAPDDEQGIEELNRMRTKLSLYPGAIAALESALKEARAALHQECFWFYNALSEIFADWDREFHARATERMLFFYPGDRARAEMVCQDTLLFMNRRNIRKNCCHHQREPESNCASCLAFIDAALAELRQPSNP